MQDFFDRTDFDILATIQSQYAASPRMVELITRFAALIDPTADVELMVEKMVDPMTAEGWGLDVWGRIVALDRRLVEAHSAGAPRFQERITSGGRSVHTKFQ